MNKVARGKVSSKSMTVVAGDMVYVGLDVHEKSIHAAVQVNDRIEQLGQTGRHAAAMAVLTSHSGVGPITAMTFRTELHQAQRLTDGGQAAKYFGLHPRVRQSGQTRRDGPIGKTGRGHVRAILVQAAWRWIAKDESAKAVYDRLVHNTGLPQKAIVGMARRLAVCLWRMMTTGELYRPAA